MHWIDYWIAAVPLALILGVAVYSGKYVRGVADFLAAGRVAGRYVISVGDLEASLSVLTLIALCEAEYQCGMAVGFWGKLIVPVAIFISLTGYVLYRYRQTRALSMGQFLEMRYNRPLRVVAAAIRTIAELLTNAIGPAVAARFFIYFMGLPLSIRIFGLDISTFAIVIGGVLLLALLVLWRGGRISLLVTDSIQGLMCYPIFVIVTCFILSEISWHNDVAPVMLDRVPGESFLNPNEIQSLRDFNLFALIVTIIGYIVNRGAWIGNDTSACGRTPHEQKMAGILGSWRNGFSTLMMTLLAVFMVTIMNAGHFAEKASTIRKTLVSRIVDDIGMTPEVRNSICERVQQIPPMHHTIGKDKPFSREHNPDVAFLNAAREELQKFAGSQIKRLDIAPDSAEAEQIKGAQNTVFQKVRTLYYQMMAPVLFRNEFPAGIAGLFALLMIMLMLSTDDSRIFNAAATLVQDVIMPLRKRPFDLKTHLTAIRWMSVGVCVFFFLFSLCFSQLDYIRMFLSIMCSLWLGAAGPIMLGGLYTRWGNTTGAFCAIFFGSGSALLGVFLQRCWADLVYPFLVTSGGLAPCTAIFDFVTYLFSPYVVWEMNPEKFPINSYEIYFISMILGFSGYIAGSLLTWRGVFDLDRMLHRESVGDAANASAPAESKMRKLYSKLIGITPEYTRGDRVVAWSVFGYSIVYQFLIAFAGVAVWNAISPWSAEYWSWYFFITLVVVGILVGSVSTVWFLWGGIRDIRRLFIDLAHRVDNPDDDGWVSKK